MTGPVVLLLLVLTVVPVVLLLLRLDAWLTERAYQRRQRGDESARYAAARAAIARRTAHTHVQIPPRKAPHD
jgi:hypothetical protein